MVCAFCSSLNEAECSGEIMLHVCGPTHAIKPGVLTFPQILVCLNCGASRFNASGEVLRQLQEEIARPAAA